jgi:hypothetical protein
MTTLLDIHKLLYEAAAELHDGPDADKADGLREYADSLVPGSDAVIVEGDEDQNPTTGNGDPTKKGTASRGDTGNTTTSR